MKKVFIFMGFALLCWSLILLFTGRSVTSLKESISISSIKKNAPISVLAKLNYEESAGSETKDSGYIARNEEVIHLTKTEHLQWNICKYTPFIYKYYADYLQYLFEKSELERFSLHSLVDVVYAETSIMLETENIDTAMVDESSEISFSTAKQMVKINNPNYTGVGIKIGIIDVALPDTEIPFTNGSIKECYGIETEVDSHPRIIGSILGGNQGIASGADLYFFQLKITGTAAELQKHGMYAALDWMIEQQINIINMSMSINPTTSNYDGYSAYIDYCVSKYKFSFVKSAGNNGYTTSPGLGLNVITVGAINSGKKLWNTSGRGVSSQYEELICKPTLVAPGVKLKAPYAPAGTGTSYAAPIITGMIALLMEEFPAIRFQPEIILSVLVNGAETLPSQTSLWDSECGAGLANYTEARRLLTNHQYYGITANNTSYPSGIVNSVEIYIPQDQSITICFTHIISPEEIMPSSQTMLPSFTKFRISVMDYNETELTSYYCSSNILLFTYTNTSGMDDSFTFSIVMFGNCNDVPPYYLSLSYS